MHNTIILRHGSSEFRAREWLKTAHPGDAIFGIDTNPAEVGRWPEAPMPMTHEQYARMISSIGDHSAPDALAASVPGVPADEIRRVWDAYHMSVRDLRAATGLSQARFAERFLIPTRTVENWERGVNECPIYTRMMIADILGFLPPRC